MQKLLIAGANKLGVELNVVQAEQLLQYLNILRQWNKIHNLCADASYEHMMSYHLLDSISISGNIDLKSKHLLDVGSGAGLPGIPLAIVDPSCTIKLLDAKAKKIAFIRHVINVLELKNVTVVLSRIEDYIPQEPPVVFDIVVSRAFASLTNFIKLSGRFCDKDGLLVAMKSDPSELVLGAAVIDDYKIINIKNLVIPGVAAKRSLVLVGT